jgi:hypothetical protein
MKCSLITPFVDNLFLLSGVATRFVVRLFWYDITRLVVMVMRRYADAQYPKFQGAEETEVLAPTTSLLRPRSD